jgi:hypothetical protein
MKHNPKARARVKESVSHLRCCSASSPTPPGSTADRTATSWRCYPSAEVSLH